MRNYSCLTDLKEQAANDAEALIQAGIKNDMFLDILEKLPECIPDPDKIHAYAAYSDVHIDIHADSLPEALEIAERCNPLNIFKHQGGSCSFKPESQINFNKGKNTCVGPYFLHVDSLRDHRPHTYKTTLNWFICVGDYLVQVVCFVTIPHQDLHRNTHITFDKYGNAHKHHCNIINKTGYFAHQVKWGSGSEEYPNSFTLY